MIMANEDDSEGNDSEGNGDRGYGDDGQKQLVLVTMR